MRSLATVVVVGLVALFQAAPVAPPATVQGVVIDHEGAAVAGAGVELMREQRVERRAVTDTTGAFRFEAVAAGRYTVRASAAGLGVTAVQVVVGASPVSPLRLTLGTAPGARTLPAPPATESAARVRKDAQALAGLSYPESLSRRLAAPFNTEAYDRINENGFHRVHVEPVSTFSIDVDTASYANVRRFLGEGRLPPPDAVRTEELINYFRFNYADPEADAPFSVTTEVAACPWNPKHHLALVGLQAPTLRPESTPPRNLVFLLDVSGSMTPPDKLPLVKTAMRMLADTLTPADRVAIVVYAGASGLVLPSTPGNRKSEIHAAIENLSAGGSTNGAAGIRLAYDTAADSFIKGGINRVILATDGDFNVGVTSQGELIRLIEEQRARGVFLSVLGVGTGNLKDSTMEKLADKGNGNYSYLDSLHEARRVLIAEAGATLVTVAKDVKIQIEFNPRNVGAYRLIGYENRLLAREDFNDDRKDAGEIGAGHTVTALYELIQPGQPIDGPQVDPLKYQNESRPNAAAASGELMTVKLRYKKPDEDQSRLLSVAVKSAVSELTPNLGFAAAVAEFGHLLRKSEHKGSATWSAALALAKRFQGEDGDGYRAELIRLIELAAALDQQSSTEPEARRQP